jgi:hypothetical protein
MADLNDDIVMRRKRDRWAAATRKAEWEGMKWEKVESTAGWTPTMDVTVTLRGDRKGDVAKRLRELCDQFSTEDLVRILPTPTEARGAAQLPFDRAFQERVKETLRQQDEDKWKEQVRQELRTLPDAFRPIAETYKETVKDILRHQGDAVDSMGEATPVIHQPTCPTEKEMSIDDDLWMARVLIKGLTVDRDALRKDVAQLRSDFEAESANHREVRQYDYDCIQNLNTALNGSIEVSDARLADADRRIDALEQEGVRNWQRIEGAWAQLGDVGDAVKKLRADLETDATTRRRDNGTTRDQIVALSADITEHVTCIYGRIRDLAKSTEEHLRDIEHRQAGMQREIESLRYPPHG